MTCPRCSVSEISPLTGMCDLCGFAPAVGVAVESEDAVASLAKRQIEHEFEFKGLIGRRDGTTVQRVVERSSGRTLILKVLVRRTADRDAEEWFRYTMNALAGFDHPNLTRVVRHGSTDSIFWFATEDHEAISLDDRLREHGPMDLRATRRLLTQVAGGLEYLHRRALVHGALKASNVLVDQDGWVRLVDVSLTRPAPPSVPLPGTARAARPSWVAPEEESRGERLPAADQYALGALAFECLTGATPGSSADAAAHLRAEVPPRLVVAIGRALDEDPTRRFPSCSDFLWALEEDAAQRTPHTPTPAVPAPKPRATPTKSSAPIPRATPSGSSAPIPRATPTGTPAPIARSTPLGMALPNARSTPTASPAVKARASARLTSEVVMIRDWERAPDPRRTLIRALQISLGVIAVVGLAFAVSTVRTIMRPTVSRPPATTTTPAAIVIPPVAARPSGATAPTSRVPRSTTTAPPIAKTVAPATASPAPAAATGAKLFINASPWGQVSIDGTAVGNTPRANVDLTAGSHVIRVSRAGYVTWERTVRVAAGETVRITDIVLVPTQP